MYFPFLGIVKDSWLVEYKIYENLNETLFSVPVVCSINSVSLCRWPTSFKHKVIQQSKTLPTSGYLEELIYCAETTSNEKGTSDGRYNLFIYGAFCCCNSGFK